MSAQRMGSCWAARLAVVFAAAVCACWAFGAASASAVVTRPLVASFGSGGTNATTFQNLDQLAFDQGSQRLFALDQGPSQVLGFDASTPRSFTPLGGGFPLSVSSAGGEDDLAVDSASHNVYYASNFGGQLYGFDAGGSPLAGFPLSGFGALCGVAVDPTGHVWAGDAGAEVIEEFAASGGSPIASVSTAAQGEPCHLAFDGNGDVYVAMFPGATFKYTAASGYAAVSQVDPGLTVALTVDPVSHDVYVVHPGVVSVYDASGNHLYDFGGSVAGASFRGIAVDQATDRVLVANDGSSPQVDVFGSVATLPDVTTSPPSNLTGPAATLNGTVNPDGLPVSSCQFEYGPTSAYGHTAPCAQNPGSGSSPVTVSADLSGLQPYSFYHFRLDAGNAGGTSVGADQSFFASDGKFGLQTSGPNAVSATVSNSADPTNPTVGNPADLDTQAGSHPFDVTTSFLLHVDSAGNLPPSLTARDFYVNTPPGLVGSATAAPQCPMSDLTGYLSNTPNPPGCPTGSQVGVIQLALDDNAGTGPSTTGLMPVYNMVPLPGAPAELGFVYEDQGQPVVFRLRSDGDFGLTAVVPRVTEVVNVVGSTLTLWGVPADPAHDAQRFLPYNGTGWGALPPGDANGNPLPAGVPEKPFITLPTKCGPSPLQATVSTDSWLHAGRLAADGLPDLSDPAWVSDSVPMFPNGITGCDRLSFNPSMSLQPDTQAPNSPAGVNFDLSVPQDENPGDLATPALENSTVTLPTGLVVSPSAADGLQGCTDDEIALHSLDPATCPDGSDIGTVTVRTPLLPDPLSGQIFLGTPNCDPCTDADAADGNMLRGYIQVQGDGVIVKLPGFFTADPSTGQLTAHFDNNPPLPFDDLKLSFKGGARGLVATPGSCGTFTSTSDFEPWSSPFSGPDATPSSSFDVTGCGDPNVFAPSFTAGVTNPQAAAYSPFTLTFSRSDADQPFSGLTATLPPGVTGKLAGIPLCSDQDASAGTCPAASRVGSATVASGPGSEPLWIPQPEEPQPTLYLTGPYKGAPYGLAVEAPAIAGPFNLGTVVVRQALYVDPTDAHVTAVSDPFPTMLDGVPLQIRTVSVTLDRRDFTLNPSSCDPMRIAGTLTSTGGLSAPVSSRFQVGGCQGLGFSPRLSFSLTGRGRTHSGNHPNLTATLTQGPGQANIRSARVALPLSLALDTNNSQHVCNYDTAQAVHGGAVACPASTVIGQATAVTPLLDRPLSGPVYLVQGIRFGKQGQRIHTLPSLLIPLRGQIALDLRASSAVNGAQQLVTTFSTIPDAPVSKFTLTINGGPKGILVITGRGQTICGKAQVANSNFGAQSGRANTQNDTMATPCGKAARKHARRHGKRHGKRQGGKR